MARRAPKCREAPITSADSLMTVWVQQICRGVPPDDIIATIAAHLKTAKGEDRYEWASRLQLILSITNRDHEALRLLDQVMEEFPDDVLLPMKKATINLYFVHDLEEALKWINVAMERAHRSGSFQREALGNKARILLKVAATSCRMFLRRSCRCISGRMFPISGGNVTSSIERHLDSSGRRFSIATTSFARSARGTHR